MALKNCLSVKIRKPCDIYEGPKLKVDMNKQPQSEEKNYSNNKYCLMSYHIYVGSTYVVFAKFISLITTYYEKTIFYNQ